MSLIFVKSNKHPVINIGERTLMAEVNSADGALNSPWRDWHPPITTTRGGMSHAFVAEPPGSHCN
jgi:hypothetical protein